MFEIQPNNKLCEKKQLIEDARIVKWHRRAIRKGPGARVWARQFKE